MTKLALHIVFGIIFFVASNVVMAQNININGPAGSGQFGFSVTVLTNGNYIVTDPYYDEGSMVDVGAVYLYNGSTHTLISTLKGSTANDRVGFGGITVLSNGNYVVSSPYWDNGAAADAGAVTFGNGTTGISGVISSTNSLVGSKTSDNVGGSVIVLNNGNYVVGSDSWDNGAVTNAGAATFGSGTTGISGIISSSNSLVGSNFNDGVGVKITALHNGNYVVVSVSWDNGALIDAGAATFGNGTTGITGIISSSNSLVGSSANDQVGIQGVTTLSNGNYVVCSPNWTNGAILYAGAATWGSGTTGVSGVVSNINSLVGSKTEDNIGNYVAALSNGNYVVYSPYWDNGAISNVGAATWGNGTIGVSGVISSTNSLIGGSGNDNIGSYGVTALKNGNYVVSSPVWNNGAISDAGAATWGNGTTGVSGFVSSSNSLVGSTGNDYVGNTGITALSNGNYVVGSYLWDNGTVINAGAATWGNGTIGISGTISSSNSLVGTTTNEEVGNIHGFQGANVPYNGIIPLSNGNYVVGSTQWDNGAGAVTFGNGTTGISGVISSNNSLVGSIDFAGVSWDKGITPLTNGNYVVRSYKAATWGNGTTGVKGVINSNNSLVGITAFDFVFGGTIPLSNGNYVVSNFNWTNGSIANVGAATWGNGTTGITGLISSSNSLVGSTTSDIVGGALSTYNNIKALANGNYVVSSPYWDNGTIVNAGALTMGNGTTGVAGIITDCNSVKGVISDGGINMSYAFNPIYNYLVVSRHVNNVVTISFGTLPAPIVTAGSAITFCNGGSVTLTSNAGSGNQWYKDGIAINGSTGSTLNITTSGSYTVRVTVNGCESAASNAIVVTVNPTPPTPTITAGGAIIFCAGGSVTLTSNAANGNQWYKDGVAISGSTGVTYSATTSGSYTTKATVNGCESPVSNAIVVTVNPTPPTPTIAAGTATAFCTGGSVTITSNASNGNQWYKDGVAIGGSTSTTLNVITSGSYTVKATASGCESAASNAIVVTVNTIPSTPTITAGGSTTFCTGGIVTLTSNAVNGNQWYKDGVVISGSVGTTLNVNSSGSYTTKVTLGGCESAASNSIVVTVNTIPPTPTVTAGGATTFCVGGSVILTSNAATGNQWYKDGVIISGSTSTTLNVTTSGSYTVKATLNHCESLVSNAVVVTVNPVPATPTITQNGNQLSSSAVSGNQWYLNAGIIAGATGQNYTASTSGNYTVQVTVNNCTSAFSAAFNFVPTALPNIDVFGTQFKVLPNPVRDKVIITRSSSNITNLNIQLTDMSGRLLKILNSNASRIEIDMSSYASGVYIVRIEDKSTKLVGKKLLVKL